MMKALNNLRDALRKSAHDRAERRRGRSIAQLEVTQILDNLLIAMYPVDTAAREGYQQKLMRIYHKVTGEKWMPGDRTYDLENWGEFRELKGYVDDPLIVCESCGAVLTPKVSAKAFNGT